MNETRRKIWKGDPSGLKQAVAEAAASLISPFYSAATEERAKGRRVKALTFAVLAIISARLTRRMLLAPKTQDKSLFAIPANTLDVMGATFLNFPWFIGGSVRLAAQCYSTASDPGHAEQRENKLLPHQKSLIQTGLAKCLARLGEYPVALENAARSAKRKDLILRERDGDLAKRQLVRILRDDAIILIKHGAELEVSWGRELVRDALQIIDSFGTDGESQRRKFIFALEREGIKV